MGRALLAVLGVVSEQIQALQLKQEWAGWVLAAIGIVMMVPQSRHEPANCKIKGRWQMKGAMFLAVCCLAHSTYAQSAGLGGAVFYDVRAKAFTPIVVSPIATLHDVLGHKGWQVTLDGYQDSRRRMLRLSGSAHRRNLRLRRKYLRR